MEHRIIIFPKELKLIPKKKLKKTLLSKGFMLENLEYDKESNFKYLLSPEYIKLLELPSPPEDYYTHLYVWVETYKEPELYFGKDITETDVKAPDSEKVLGDNDFVMQLLEQLLENPNARYTDKNSGKTWNIRDLDYSRYLAFGRTFIVLSCGFDPTKEFMDKLNNITGCDMKYSFWAM